MGGTLFGVKQAARMYCISWGIQPIFCNNCKGSLTFKTGTKNIDGGKQVYKDF